MEHTKQEQEYCQAYVQVGQTAIQVADEQFQQGYHQGYAHFVRWWAKRTFTDGTMYTFLVTNLMNAHASNRQNAGYVTGWLAALLEGKQEQEASREEAAEQKGDGDGPHLLHGPC